jgi:hypothetical protein
MSFNKSLHGYSDSDWAGDLGDRKSTGGFIFLLSNGAVAWRSKKQTIIALSTTEAEYIAASEAGREAIWLQRLVGDLMAANLPSSTGAMDEVSLPPTIIFTDSTGGLAQIANTRHHERTKHIDIKYHFVRDICEREIITFRHISTHEMAADILTKPLTRVLHWGHMERIGLETLS